MRKIAAFLGLLTLLLVGLLALRLRAQEQKLRGPVSGSAELEGTLVRVSAKLAARVVALPFKEGDSVKEGDVVAKLDCAEPEQLLAEATARQAVAMAQARASEAQAGAALGTKRAAAAAVLASKAQIAALSAQRDASKRQADRLEAVPNDVPVSNRDQVRASADGLEHQVNAALASSEASAGQASAASGQASAAAAQMEGANSAVRAAEAAVARARLLVAECELHAPRAGVLEELPFELGELVGPGAILARIVDLREVKATFYVPNAEVSAVKPGASVDVTPDAYPKDVWKGEVRTVSVKAEFTPRNIQTRTDRDRLVFPVEIFLANPDGRLRAGMPVTVTLPGTGR